MNRLLITVSLIMLINLVQAQSRVDIRFSPTSLGETKSCMDLELKSLENSDISLAGQNYRIYYNPQKISLLDNNIATYGHQKVYGKMRSLRKHHSEEIDITMINLATDALEFDKNKVTILHPQEWIKTSNVCFSHAQNEQFELTWARPKETSELATAFVSLSEWVTESKQTKVIVNEYFDFDNGHIATTDLFQTNINIYPNPVVEFVNVQIGPFSEMSNGMVIVVDVSGNLIRKQKIDRGVSAYQIDMKDTPAGSYFLKIVNERDEKVFHSAFVKSSL
ncbi:MAG: T9SS type A sorting domain-containing protein [Saprospiraceae bacterium]